MGWERSGDLSTWVFCASFKSSWRPIWLTNLFPFKMRFGDAVNLCYMLNISAEFPTNCPRPWWVQREILLHASLPCAVKTEKPQFLGSWCHFLLRKETVGVSMNSSQETEVAWSSLWPWPTLDPGNPPSSAVASCGQDWCHLNSSLLLASFSSCVCVYITWGEKFIPPKLEGSRSCFAPVL